MPFENIVGKEENAGNQHFLLFPQFFLSLSKAKIFTIVNFILLSGNAFNLDQSRILSFGKEFNPLLPEYDLDKFAFSANILSPIDSAFFCCLVINLSKIVTHFGKKRRHSLNIFN